MTQPTYTRQQLAAKIKEKYPAYAEMDDNTLVDKITAKYPQYLNQIEGGKTQAVAGGAATVAADQPSALDLQSENGLSESPRKSIRKQTREKDIQRNENIFNEKVSVAEKGFYEATNVDEAELYEQTLQELEKEFAVAGKPVTKGTYMGSTYTYTPADDYVGDKKAMYDIYTSGGGVSLSEDYLAETLFNKKKTLATAYICLLYTSPSPRDRTRSRMPSSA